MAPTNLYFVDIRKLLYSARSEFIPQLGDAPLSPDNVVGGGNGYVACVTTTNITDVAHIPETGHTAFGTASTEHHGPGDHATPRRKKPTADMLNRVWTLHDDMGHTSLRIIGHMLHQGDLHGLIKTEAGQGQEC